MLLFLLLHSQMLSFILQVLAQFCLIRNHNLLRQKTYVWLRDIHIAEPPAKECSVLASSHTM